MENEIIITNHQPQDITITQDENQLIFVNGGGQVIGITDVRVNGSSVVTNNIAYVIVPVKTSQLTNDGANGINPYLSTETDPTVPNYVKAISLADINSWNNKQNELVSGSTIKTINNTSLLGSGNIEIDGAVYTAGTGIDITNNEISNTITSYDDLTDLPTIPEKVSDLINDLDYVRDNELAEVAFTGSYASLSNTPENLSEFNNDTNYVDTTDLSTALADKQDTLVSGTNIKTINNTSLLGSGDISIGGGTATDVQINGTSIVSSNTANIITESAYNSSSNKIATMSDITSYFESGTFTPSISGVTTAGTTTYSNQFGIYYKIGKLIFYDFKLAIASTSNGSGLIKINNLPYISNINSSCSDIGNLMVSGPLSTNTLKCLWNTENGIILSSSNLGIGGTSYIDTSSTTYIYGHGYYFLN